MQLSAISPMTSARETRAKPLAVEEREPSRSDVATAASAARSAGSRPVTNAVTSAASAANPIMRASRSKCIHVGGPEFAVCANDATSQRTPIIASGKAIASAASDRIRLSSTRCSASRPRLAPSAARTASSWRRPRIRVNNRLAALAAATSNTSTTAISIMPISARDCVLTRERSKLSTSGCSSRKYSTSLLRASTNQASSRARTCAASKPACGLIIVENVNASRRGASRAIRAGTQIFCLCGKLNSGSMTPMIVASWPFTRTGRPTMSAAPAKPVCQTSCEMIAVSGASAASSALVKARPSTGCTPSIGINPAEKNAPL